MSVAQTLWDLAMARMAAERALARAAKLAAKVAS